MLSIGGSEADGIGKKNPIRYRGYYYDEETGFYYVSSRYYDPEIGCFLNADGYVSTGMGLLGYNMFAYCNNNPINLCDCNGCCPHNGKIVELYNTNCSSCNFAIGENDYELYANLLMYKEHSKKVPQIQQTIINIKKDKHEKSEIMVEKKEMLVELLIRIKEEILQLAEISMLIIILI